MRPLFSPLVKAGATAGLGAALLALLGPSARYPLQGIAAAASDVYVAVVVDFGGLSGAPSQPVATCAEVPSGSTMADALAVGAKQVASAYPVPGGALGWAPSGLLCQIDGLPTAQQVSNCDSIVNGKYQYWSFWTAGSATWSYAQVGPASIVAVQGAVEGYRFELSGSGDSTDLPPAISPDFSRICPATSPAGSPATTKAAPSPSTTATVTSQAHEGTSSSVSGGSADTTSVRPGAAATQTGVTTPTSSSLQAGPLTTGGGSTTATLPKQVKLASAGGGGGSKLEFAGVGAFVALLAAGAALRMRKGAP